LQPASTRNDYESKRKQLKLQVRSSPQKAPAKAPVAKKTKKLQTQFPSTNVPSPIRAPKQKIQSFAYNDNDDDDDDDEEDAFDAPWHPTGNKTARGYQADDFDDDFAPIRVAKPLRATKAKGIGVPITTDRRTEGLTELQTDVLRDFMNGAKQLRKNIEERKGHREAIFTDTVLREMGLDLPMSLDEMKTIPGIRPEMVDLYGKQFLTLVYNTRDFYGDDTPVPRNPQLCNRRPQQSRVIHEIDDDEEVDDQNHRLVVDLCSDDEEVVPVGEGSEEESFYGDFGEDEDEDEDDDDALHTSHHFSHFQNPDVAEFNNRYTQLGGGAAPSTSKATKPPAARGGSKAPGSGYKKKGSFRKRASGSFGKSTGGVKKRASKGSSSRASGGATTASKSSGRGRGGGTGAAGGWGGIMAMPG
jgi:bloom syndrome protein